MKLIALLSLLGGVSSLSTNKQYTYHFISQVLTGIPKLNSQYAGLRITADVVLQKHTDQTLRIHILNTKYQNYNDVLTLSEEKDILDTEEVDMPSDIKVHLEAIHKSVDT